MMKHIVLAVSIALFGGAAAQAGITNGGFETGDLTGWTSDSPFGYNPFGTTYGAGMEGTHWAWLSGFEYSIFMEQTVTGLTVGTKYNLDFIMASEFTESDSLIVTVDGLNPVTFTAPPYDPSGFNGGFWTVWVPQQYTFVATATSHTIRFSTHDFINAAAFDVGFDDVRLSPAVAVPEPASMTLLGLGVAGLFGYRARRRMAAAV